MDTTDQQDALAKVLTENPISAGLFDRLRVEQLSDTGLIDALVAAERLVRHAAGLQTRVLGALAARQECEDGLTDGIIESEVIAATRWAPSTTRRRLDRAGQLVTRFPETLDLLDIGRVAWPQAAALVELTWHLEPDMARAVQARVLPRMPHQSLAATRKALHRAVLALDPHGAAARHEQESERRRVVLYPEPDGMATLALYTPAPTGAALLAAIDAHATARDQCDGRSLDQRRADILTHLVLTSTVQPSGTQHPDTRIPALIQITVGIDTLLGTDQQPATLGATDRSTPPKPAPWRSHPDRYGEDCLPPPTAPCCTLTRIPTGPRPASSAWCGYVTSTAPFPAAPCPQRVATWTMSSPSTTTGPWRAARASRRTCTPCADATID